MAAFTPDPFAHELLAAQREERLARKAARHLAIGALPKNRAIRGPVAHLLRAAANRLAPVPEASTQRPPAPNHIHVHPRGL